jgi:pimeloyl-ACP methyl ester carboxylesterase
MGTRLVEGVAIREWGDADEPGVLLWPGLGFTGAYFAEVAPLLAGRCVAVDPPGWGGSPPLDVYTYERLVELVAELVRACCCSAILGHSLGGDIAVGVATAPPPELKAVVLVDGGYLDDAARRALGSPRGISPEQTLEWARTSEPRYPDWSAAVRDLAADCGGRVSAALEAVLRDVLVEVDGEVRGTAEPEAVAGLVIAVRRGNAAALAAGVAVPTLLVACARPGEHRVAKQRAWEAFAAASPLIELHVADTWFHHPFLQAPEASAQLVRDWLHPHA